MSGEGQVNPESADNPHSQIGMGGRSDPGISSPAGDRRRDDENAYKTNNRQRGKFILINNKTFDPITGMKEIKGTDAYVANLKRVFERLGFRVECHDNKRAGEMLRIMEKAGQEDHSDSDCIAVAVLSYGEQGVRYEVDEQCVLYGIDHTITAEQLVEPIKQCSSLAGKPKLFFFQASQGSSIEDAIKPIHKDDGESEDKKLVARIPQGADFLFVYSIFPGKWFVTAFCDVLEKQAYNGYDFLRLMTRASKKMIDSVKSYCSDLGITPRRNLAWTIVSQLTKDLYFNS